MAKRAMLRGFAAAVALLLLFGAVVSNQSALDKKIRIFQDWAWYFSHWEEMMAKYAGHYVAIANKEVLLVRDSLEEVLRDLPEDSELCLAFKVGDAKEEERYSRYKGSDWDPRREAEIHEDFVWYYKNRDTLIQEHGGKLVVVRKERVIASAVTMEEIMDQLEAREEDGNILLRVGNEDEPLFPAILGAEPNLPSVMLSPLELPPPEFTQGDFQPVPLVKEEFIWVGPSQFPQSRLYLRLGLSEVKKPRVVYPITCLIDTGASFNVLHPYTIARLPPGREVVASAFRRWRYNGHNFDAVVADPELDRRFIGGLNVCGMSFFKTGTLSIHAAVQEAKWTPNTDGSHREEL